MGCLCWREFMVLQRKVCVCSRNAHTEDGLRDICGAKFQHAVQSNHIHKHRKLTVWAVSCCTVLLKEKSIGYFVIERQFRDGVGMCLSPLIRAIVGSCTPSRYHFPFCRCTVCREAGEPQLVHTAAGLILLQRVSMLSGMETSAGKVFRICKLFPNFQDTPWSICATPAVRNVHGDWRMTHFSAASSAKLDGCVGLCDVTNSADDK